MLSRKDEFTLANRCRKRSGGRVAQPKPFIPVTRLQIFTRADRCRTLWNVLLRNEVVRPGGTPALYFPRLRQDEHTDSDTNNKRYCKRPLEHNTSAFVNEETNTAVRTDMHHQNLSSFHGSAVLLYPFTSQKPGLSFARNSSPLTHFAPFHAYRRGVKIRIGPPCSRSRGTPFTV